MTDRSIKGFQVPLFRACLGSFKLEGPFYLFVNLPARWTGSYGDLTSSSQGWMRRMLELSKVTQPLRCGIETKLLQQTGVWWQDFYLRSERGL
jgi:hypothetical protein